MSLIEASKEFGKRSLDLREKKTFLKEEQDVLVLDDFGRNSVEL